MALLADGRFGIDTTRCTCWYEDSSFGHATRQDYWQTLDRRVLDATIEEGWRINDDLGPDEILPYLGFAMIRRAYLYPAQGQALPLDTVLQLLQKAPLCKPATVGHDTCLNEHDIALAAATARYIVWNPSHRRGPPALIGHLRELVFDPSADSLVRREARMLLAQALLELACDGRPWPWRSRSSWTTQLVGEACQLLDAALGEKRAPTAATFGELREARRIAPEDPATALGMLRSRPDAPTEAAHCTEETTQDAPVPDRRIQAVVAMTPLVASGVDSSALSASAGVRQPRVLRGRPLSSSATASR